MKKKTVSILLTLSMVGCMLCGCASAEQPDQLSMEDVNERIEQAIADNNKTFQSELLAKVDEQIQTKFGEIDKLTDTEKEELYNSIMASVKEELKNNKSTTAVKTEVVRQPVTEKKYYNTYTTVVAPEQKPSEEQKPSDEQKPSESKPEEYPKIEDGTVIAVSNELPYTYKYAEDIDYTVTNISIKAYNHVSEPYQELEYPYELRVEINGTYIHDNDRPLISKLPFGYLTLDPHGTSFKLNGGTPDLEAQTFSSSTTIPVRMLPDSVTFVANED